MRAGRPPPHSMETATPAPPQIAAPLDVARAALAEFGADQAALAAGFEAAQAVAALTLDADLAAGTMLHWVRMAGLARDSPQLDSRLGSASTRIAEQLERLGELHLPAGWSAGQGLNTQQAEILRNMLLAVAADPRLVVAHLGEQLVQLRDAREDLSFRYLEPEDYHRIPRALAERRVDRERYIEQVCALLQRELRQAGIAAAAVY